MSAIRDSRSVPAFAKGLRIAGWVLASLALLYPVAALEAWSELGRRHPAGSLGVAFYDSSAGWLGLRAAFWGLVWLVVVAVLWALRRRRFDGRALAVLLAVFLAVCLVMGIGCVMWREFGIAVAALDPCQALAGTRRG